MGPLSVRAARRGWPDGLLAAAVVGTAAALLLPSCVEDAVVQKNPVPSGELLVAADCPPALQTYRQLLQVPSSRGAVVTNRVSTTRSEETQERAAQSFADQCPRLVGHIRRAVVRCWHDAPDIETFQTCSQRF